MNSIVKLWRHFHVTRKTVARICPKPWHQYQSLKKVLCYVLKPFPAWGSENVGPKRTSVTVNPCICVLTCANFSTAPLKNDSMILKKIPWLFLGTLISTECKVKGAVLSAGLVWFCGFWRRCGARIVWALCRRRLGKQAWAAEIISQWSE